MRHALFVATVLLLCASLFTAAAQQAEGISNTLNISKYRLPPILSITDISFSKSTLKAQETGMLTIKLKNTGPGAANNVYVSLSGYLKGLSFPSKSYFPDIPANGGEKSVDIHIKAGMDIPADTAELRIEVVEENFKVRIAGKLLRFYTQAFQKPRLIIARNALIEQQSAHPNNQIDVNEMLDLKLAIQNVGEGKAENIKIKVHNKQTGVMFLGVAEGEALKRAEPSMALIASGKYETVVYRYFVNSEFSDSELEFIITATERYGKYGFTETKTYPINKQLEAQGEIRKVDAAEDELRGEAVIEDIPEFVVDVDVNIPAKPGQNEHAYALIIGNEDYRTRQPGLRVEQNVPYAENDALAFAQYCQKTLGIPANQTKLIKNGTATEIKQALDWLNNLAEIEEGKAVLYFYYSGHGLPHEQTREPYFIPVDVSGHNLDYAIKTSEVYAKLSEHPAEMITVFIDACFSGGAKAQPLVAMKGVKIPPKEHAITNNMVVFSSSTGDESSAVYREKHHGYFTYYLLKKIQETKGDVTYQELSDYIISKVRKATGLLGKVQTPQVLTSPVVEQDWKEWKLK